MNKTEIAERITYLKSLPDRTADENRMLALLQTTGSAKSHAFVTRNSTGPIINIKLETKRLETRELQARPNQKPVKSKKRRKCRR